MIRRNGGMRMTLRHMKIFSAVYRTGSVTKAAQELHLAQPSLSVAIRELESYYGVCLFERIGRRMHPTQSGETLYGYASHIVALFDDMEKQMRNWDSLGVLRVGASITIGTYILPALLHEYQMQTPELRIEATIERASGIEQRLIDNTVDIALLERQPEHAELLAVPFMQDELRPVVPCSSPLAEEAAVTLEQLAEYPFLMREKGSSVRSVLEACFALRQMSVHPVWESASTQAIVKAVGEGLGVAVLPQMLVERDAQEGAVRMLRFQEPLRRNLNIVYHRSKYLTRNMERFIELCRHSAAQPCIGEKGAQHT